MAWYLVYSKLMLGKTKVLAAFLEGDNIKLLVFEKELGKGLQRVFAGRISFAQEVVRDGFVADGAKFSSQVKIAFAQKEILRQTNEVILFLPSDKTFTKTIPQSDAIDAFVQGLPYFKEELVINIEGKVRTLDSGQLVTYVAFEKKLVEDAQRPFLEMGKKVTAVKSPVSTLANKFIQTGQYFLLVPLEKELAIASVDCGGVSSLATFKYETAASRIGEFVGSHNLKEIKTAYILGTFDQGLLDKIHTQQGWQVTSLQSGDIYDLIVATCGGKTGGLSKISLPNINPRYLFLGLAVAVGLILVVTVVRNIDTIKNLGAKPVKKEEVVAPVAPPPVVPEPKPAEFPLRIQNGTLVTGEAGRLAETLKGLGYDVTETKNATTAGFVATRLRVSKSVPAKISDALKSELLKTYESVTIEDFDDPKLKIEIIVGQKKISTNAAEQ